VVAKNQLLGNRASRNIAKITMLMCFTFIVERICFIILDTPFRQTEVLEFVFFFIFMGVLGIIFEHLLFIPALIYLIGLFSSAVLPDHVYLLTGLSHAIAMAVTSWCWLPGRFPED
jgi:hypothetical protein